MTELYVKNMVCKCCICVVQIEIEKSGLKLLYIDLGMVRVKGRLSEEAMIDLDVRLQKYDLGLLIDWRFR